MKAARREIHDAFSGTVYPLRGDEKILKSVHSDYKEVALEDGTYLDSMNDGRFYTHGDESERWAEVADTQYDEDGEPEYGVVVGYVRL